MLESIGIAFPRSLRRGTLLRRIQRFMAEVEVGGETLLAFVANSGRLGELMLPGTQVLLAAIQDAARDGNPGETCRNTRRTAYDLVLVEQGTSLVCVDTRVPNALVGLALRRGALPEFACYPALRPEFTYGHSRFDFWLSGRDVGCPASDLLAPPDCLVEVKSVTLMRDGVGLFPDAPTVRGRRHVTELAEAVRAGHRAAVVFVAQRSDVRSFVPNDALDPAFGAALRAAAAAGVEVHAYGCDVDRERIWLRQRLEVAL